MSLSLATGLPEAVLYSDLVAANSDLKGIIWAAKVIRSTKERFIFKHFVGGVGSGMPIIKRQDLAVGSAQKVTFITSAQARGRGVLGENVLETATEKFRFGSFGVNVDYLAHSTAWSQSLAKLSPAGKNIDQLSSDIEGDWWARREDDDFQIKAREFARLVTPGLNRYWVGARASSEYLLSTDTLTTAEVEASKGILMTHGATPIQMEVDSANGFQVDVPKYVFFGPDGFLRRLRSSSTYLATLQQAGLRGAGNELFSGKYPLWDNNVMFAHNVNVDDADGRQGSPLSPMAFLGTATTDGCTLTVLTGGGHLLTSAGALAASGTGDYFAYFKGFSWKIYDSETLPTDSNTYYLMIYNHSTDKKYEICSYVAAGVAANGSTITVTRGTTGNIAGNITAQSASRFSNSHPIGAIIIPCSSNGVPLQEALHMGAESIFHAVGSVEVERLRHYGGFQNDRGEQRLTAFGIQGIRGMEPFMDARQFARNYMLITGAGRYPNVDPLAYTG